LILVIYQENLAMTLRSMSAALGFLALLLALACSSGSAPPLEATLVAPANPMPLDGSTVVFQVASGAEDPPTYQWLKDGVPIAGATGTTLTVGPVTGEDAGSYQVLVSDGSASVETRPIDLEPVADPWVVTSAEDSGPGTLRDILAQANAEPASLGVNGIAFNLPGPGPYRIILQSALPPITGNVCIQNTTGRQLTVDGGGVCRPFFLNGGILVLDHFTVANGLGKGGDGLGGGGGAAGMGGGLFMNGGSLTLRRMTFAGNQALGGSSSAGSDGGGGGGGGFGGDSPATLGTGAGGGFLGGQGGTGYLDGSNGAGGIATPLGAGGGGARGGLPGSAPVSWTDNEEGGPGSWAGGGGFSVGPEGGGGFGGGSNVQLLGFGGGGGGAGGYIGTVLLPGVSSGPGGFCGGNGSMGDGIASTGQGGGGGGMGGAVFVHAGSFDMYQCQFFQNQATAGTGAAAGLGKGGALFIYPYDTQNKAPLVLALLQAQTYRDNTAPDQVESPDYDNDNWYISQTNLDTATSGSPIARLYARYTLQKQLGIPWFR
jgi:hypothetical protein